MNSRNLVASGRQVAVSPDQRASAAAIDILDSGGNAVDGAVAANAVLGVVDPTTCGIGGDLFALIHRPGSAPQALNASGRSGSNADAAALRSNGLDSIPRDHPASITAPGCVDGWVTLLERHGKTSLDFVLQPAIAMASGGFLAAPELARALTRIESIVAGEDAAVPLYPDGRPPMPGATLQRPDIARTLLDIARSGRAAMYTGRVAAAISAATGGWLSSSDLERNHADWVEPISIDAFGSKGWTIGPNSLAYLALAAAAIVDHLAPDPLSADYLHACIEAYRAMAWERNDAVSDAATAPHDLDWYLDADRIAQRADSLSMDKRHDWPVPRPLDGGTAYVCVRDADGCSISLIQSNYHGIGSGRCAPGTGVFLHDRGAGFTLRPGHPNELAPRRRPLHTLAPTIWTEGDDARLVLGTRGGPIQPQLVLQVASDVLYRMTAPGVALANPRWAIRDESGDEFITVEEGLPFIEELRGRGHLIEPAPEPRMEGWGPMSAILLDGDHAIGAADPRISTAHVAVAS